MAEERAQRRLAAILAVDVVGYSRLIGTDEEGTLAALKAHRRELTDPKIEQHHGRIVKTTGDGALIEFASVVDAVRYAVDVQRGTAERNVGVSPDKRIVFRIGINVGDIVIDGDDILGDGVNIAARLEGLAEPGGVLVSRAVHDQVRDRLELVFEDVGERELKNIARPVRVYRVQVPAESIAALARGKALPLPDKPSIAVLPFTNMSGDPEQEYFADGVVEEIITALSRFRGLFVIARNSTFTYKGRAVDVKQVGRELGVRYVLEGSVRRAANKVRITGQLIDARTAAHLWADRFDGGLEEIFNLQDQVTASVVAAIAPKVEQVEIERAKHKPTASLDAYDYFLRGMAAVHQWTWEANTEALSNFYRAIELDPSFASAYGMAARCYAQRKVIGWVTDRANDVAESARLARRAAELGRDDAIALCTAGFALADVAADFEAGDALIERALRLNPNFAWAWLFSAWVKIWLGEPEAAIERAARAMRLSPHDPHMFIMQTATAMAHFFAGRYAAALSWAQTTLREKPDAFLAACTVAASQALAGQISEAGKAMARLRELEPALRISNLSDRYTIPRPEDFAKWVDGLRKAGLPE